MTDDQPIERRTVLRTVGGIAIASVIAGCANDGSNTAKAAKTDVSYQEQSKNGQRCSGCQYYRPDRGDKNAGKCTKVKGTIQPDAWCQLYAP